MDASAFGDKLLVLSSGGSGDWQLLWLDPANKQTATIADKLTNLQSAAISPKGDRIALTIDTGTPDIWVLDLARGVRTRLTFGPFANTDPVWSPDGKWIAYASDRGGRMSINRKASDGSGPEEVLLKEGHQLPFPTSWSSDGKYLLYSIGPVGGQEVWALPLEGDRTPFLLLTHAPNATVSMARLSSDGHWLTYTSTESGAPEVYVTAFRGQGKWQVSSNGGMQSSWGRDGKELYYSDARSNLFAVPVSDSGGAPQFGTPRPLVTSWSSPQFFYDVSPDGKKILLDRISQQVSQSVTVVTNFTSGLNKK